MKIEVTTQIGGTSYKFFIDKQKEKEAFQEAIVLGNPPTRCDECSNKEFFKFDSNKDSEGNIYINVLCRKCGAKAKLGSYKTGGFFWHKFEKYIPKNSQQGSTAPVKEVDGFPTSKDIEQSNDDDELPF